MATMDIISRIGIVFIPFLFALSVHEYAHGWMANKLGDKTAQLMGRLSLNPFAHADPVGTFILPIASIYYGGIFFGWAKPVPVNDRNLKNPKRGMAIVAAAGPGSNLIMAVIAALVRAVAIRYFPVAQYTEAVSNFAAVFIQINLFLAVFNLLPIHPLDGGKILALFLSDKTNETLEAMAPFTSLIIIGLFLFTGLGEVLLFPVKVMFAFLLNAPLHMLGVL